MSCRVFGKTVPRDKICGDYKVDLPQTGFHRKMVQNVGKPDDRFANLKNDVILLRLIVNPRFNECWPLSKLRLPDPFVRDQIGWSCCRCVCLQGSSRLGADMNEGGRDCGTVDSAN